MRIPCKVGTLIDVVETRVQPACGITSKANIHVFNIIGHPVAERCYAWLEVSDERSTTIHVVLHSKEADNATKAVHRLHRLKTDRAKRKAFELDDARSVRTHHGGRIRLSGLQYNLHSTEMQ